MTRLWDQRLGEQRRGPIPVVIPLVFYHGRGAWKVPTDFSDLFRLPRELDAYTPRFQYVLVDLSNRSEEDIRGEVVLRAMLLAMRHVFDTDLVGDLPRILGLLRTVATTRTGLEALEALLRYFSSAAEGIGERELRDAVADAFAQKGEQIMATLAEKWTEQGVRQGSVVTAQEFLMELLDARFGSVPPPLIEHIRTINDVSRLRELNKAAATAASLQEFTATTTNLAGRRTGAR